MKKISIRKSPMAKIGLIDLINWIDEKGDKPVKEMRMVEIGSFVGDSTKIFAERFKEVISVDPFLNGYDIHDDSSEVWPMKIIFKQFEEDVLKKFANVVHYRMSSIDGAKLFADGGIDFVYIDGNHLYEFVKMDIEAWLPKIARPGWIGGHDYQNKVAPGVKSAVLEMFNTIDYHFSDTSWIKRLLL